MKVPGPGAYSNRQDGYDYNEVGFGTSTRKPMGGTGGVGPGQYTENDMSKLGRNDVTMKFRHGDSIVQNKSVPGPGQYNPDVGASKPSQGG